MDPIRKLLLALALGAFIPFSAGCGDDGGGSGGGSGGGTPPTACSDGICPGCCDANDRCVIGTSDSACGYGGYACDRCSSSEECVSAGTRNSCERVENDATCARSVTSTNANAPLTYAVSDSCEDSRFCRCGNGGESCRSGGSCESPSGNFRFHVVAKLAPFKAGGATWDVADAPDPFVEIYKNDVLQLQSTTANNTLDIAYVSGSLNIAPGDKITIRIWDEDVTSHDEVDGFAWTFNSEPGARFVRRETAQADVFVTWWMP